MEALDVDQAPEAVVRAFTTAVSERCNGCAVATLPLDLERGALESGSLDDTPVIRKLAANGRFAHAHYFVYAVGVTFVVQWPCGTLKRYDVELG